MDDKEIGSPAGDLLGSASSGVEFGPTGLTFVEPIDGDDWTALVSMLGGLEARIPWWIGDALIYGEHRLGKKYADAAAATGLAEQTLKNYRWVASKVPPENRDPELPWRLHREIARLNPDEQPEWIERTKHEGWTADDLRREMVAAAHQQDAVPDFEPTDEDEQGRLDQTMVKCPRCGKRFEP